jgi:hypothetical protein
MKISRDGCPGHPYIEFGVKACYKEKVPRSKGRQPEGGPN